MTKQCSYCHNESDFELLNGEPICEGCAANKCDECGDGEREYEIHGCYWICVDCKEGRI